MYTQPETQEWQGVIRWREREPIFGRFSLWMLAAAAVIVVVSFVIPFVGSFGESGMAFIVVGLWAAAILCIGNLAIASIGLARRESPRWPAITGLLLSVLPSLGGIYLFCGAPW
jgi:hypothetical protein